MTVELSDDDAEYVLIMLLGISALTGGEREWDHFLQRHVEIYTGRPADSLSIGERVREIASKIAERSGGGPDER